MVDKHPSGNPRLIEQHKKIQREGDKDLAGTGDDTPQPQRKTKQKHQRALEERNSDNSGSKTDGGSFVGP